jgi:hypothetical protein
VFISLAGFSEHNPTTGKQLICQAMRCQGCQKFILGLAEFSGGTAPPVYLEHYPLGRPDDSVPKEVGDADSGIASDFAEALRCLWVRSYKAAIAMCGRALQSSCDHLNAQGSSLYEQIDDLATKGIITQPLKEWAHAVRLSRNKELHAKTDGLSSAIDQDAEAIIAFTREYFHHVYVMPAKLKAYTSRPTATSAVAVPTTPPITPSGGS